MELISATRRSNYVPFPRWIDLVLEYFHQGYNINSGPEHSVPLLSSRIIQDVPGPNDAFMTQKMLDWIDNPYTVDPSQYQRQPEPILNPAQHLDQDQDMEDTASSSYHSCDTPMVHVSASISSDSFSNHQEPEPQQPPPPINTHIYFSSTSFHHTAHTYSSARTVSDAEGEHNQNTLPPTPPPSTGEHHPVLKPDTPTEGQHHDISSTLTQILSTLTHL